MTSIPSPIRRARNEGKLLFQGKRIEWIIGDFLSSVFTVTKKVIDSPAFTVSSKPVRMRMSVNFVFLRMCIWSDSVRDFSIEYKFGMKKSDGSVEQFDRGVLKANENIAGHTRFFQRSEALRRKSELVPCNVLTITFTFRAVSHPTPQTVLVEPKPFSLIRLDKLSENFKGLLDSEETCDTTLKVKGKDYKAHRAVLIARSPVFAAMFMHDTCERQTGVLTIPDCDPDSFQKFLEYLYCGKIEEISFPGVLHLYETSDKYDVPEVKAFCVECMKQCVTEENICDIVVFADKYEETDLFAVTLDFFVNNFSKIFETSEWESLLKMDCLLANKLLKGLSKANVTP